MSANSPKRPRTEETEKRAVSFESLNSDDTFDNESPILRPTDSTDWIKNADKKRIVAVLRGEYPGLTIVKHSDVHAQSSGYSKIYIQKENDQFVYGTDFVICDGCGIVMGGNGGHLARHRKERCKTTKQYTAPINIPTVSQNTTKSDFDKAIIQYFAKTAKPLYSLETPEFRELILEMAKLGQNFSGELTDNMILRRGTARKLIETTIDEKEKDIMHFLLPYFKSKTVSILADFGKLSVDFLSVKCGVVVNETDDNGMASWKLLVVPLAMSPADLKSKNSFEVFKCICESIEKCDSSVNTRSLFLVADGGSNIRAAGKDHFSCYIRCGAHATEIIGKRMLSPYKCHKATSEERDSLQKYLELLEKCRHLTMELKSNKFRYKDLGISLTTANDTRWMTSYTCAFQVYSNLSKLIAQMPTLGAEATRIVMELSQLDHRQLFEELDEVYKSIKECNDFFQKNTTTIAEVLPVYLGLLDDVEQISAKPSITENNRVLLKYAEKAIHKQLADLSEAHYVGYFLHPTYKSIQNLQSRLDHHNVIVDAKMMVTEALKKFDEELNDMSNNVQISNSAPSTSASSDSFLSRRLKKTTNPQTQTLQSEIYAYNVDTMDTDPMVFWLEYKNRFPRLFRIAQKVFSCPPSEADVERSFSQLKNVYTDNRRSLELTFLQKMMLVRQFEVLDNK